MKLGEYSKKSVLRKWEWCRVNIQNVWRDEYIESNRNEWRNETRKMNKSKWEENVWWEDVVYVGVKKWDKNEEMRQDVKIEMRRKRFVRGCSKERV